MNENNKQGVIKIAAKKTSKTERSLTLVKNKKGESFRITYDVVQDVYYLYKLDGDKATKLGKADTPTELEKKYVFV